MYLTRAFIDPRRRGAVRLLGSPQVMHAAILKAMPTQPVPAATNGSRILWRLDVDNPHRPVLWLVSPEKPDLDGLMSQVGASDADGSPAWQSREYTPLLDGLRAGQRFAFRFMANPTRSVRVREGEDTKPVEHVTAEHQVRWLVERAERCGFRILHSDVTLPDTGEQALSLRLYHRERVTFSRRGRADGSGSRVTLVRVGYEGALEVTDAEALRTVLTGGLGRARAYGCGLLTLARLPVGR